MLICPNNHENLGGLSHCRVCGLPLLDLEAEFASLAKNMVNRAEMGHRAPRVLLVGLGTVGANLTHLCKTGYPNHSSEYSFLAIDADEAGISNGQKDVLHSTLETFIPTGGTFCGIGEVAIRSDAHLIPVFRRAGLNHKDDNQAAILIAGIGGGIGSAASVLVEKVRQLNPLCHVLALVVAPGEDESFHNHLNAYYALSHLLRRDSPRAADLTIALRYDRIKTVKGVGTGGQELTVNGLLASLSDLLMKNLPSQYLAEVLRVNQSLGIKLVIPCLALGRSLEIFGNLTNILESTIVFPANRISNQCVRVCHLILRTPSSQIASFREEAVNEHLWVFVKQHFPNVKAVTSYISRSDERHDRIEACLLLGGGSASSAIFSDGNSLARFRSELEKDLSWQTYGLNKDVVKLANEAIMQYDDAMETPESEKKVKRFKLDKSSLNQIRLPYKSTEVSNASFPQVPA